MFSLYSIRSQNAKLYASGWDMISWGMRKARDDRPGQGSTHGKGWGGTREGVGKNPLCVMLLRSSRLVFNVRSAMPRSGNSSFTFSTFISRIVLPHFVLQVPTLSSLPLHHPSLRSAYGRSDRNTSCSHWERASPRP